MSFDGRNHQELKEGDRSEEKKETKKEHLFHLAEPCCTRNNNNVPLGGGR